ncbi:MAG: GDSL-type esterase/lipase family protein, partial [Clostridia bacterium]|nr:GDSL-type esterase/lipase family protein [Clostridia bacterium]
AQSEAQAPAEAETPAQSAQPAQAVDVSTLPALDSGYYDEFFDGGLFIGDSITQGLQNYMVQKRKDQPRLLGDAKFVTAKSFSLEAACSDVVTDGEAALRYRGRAMTVPELLASTEAKALFILLGTNDCAGKSPADVIAPYKTLLSLVKASAPDIRLYVQSCTPIVAARETAQLSNATLDALNAELKTLAQQSGAGFIDVATALKNGGAGMEPAFSSDQYVHINEAGAQAWIDALYTYAREACAAGAWAPIAALEETAGEAPAA